MEMTQCEVEGLVTTHITPTQWAQLALHHEVTLPIARATMYAHVRKVARRTDTYLVTLAQ